MTALPDPTLFYAPTIADVSEEICAHYGVTRIELASPIRRASIAGPRGAAYYLAARLTGKSLPAIGSAFGGRDHTTVLHGRDKFAIRVAEDPILAAEMAELEDRILERAAAKAERLPPDLDQVDICAVVARVIRGGARAAISVSVIETMALCRALQEQFSAGEDEIESEPVAGGASPAPPPPSVRELTREILLADRALRARDSQSGRDQLRAAVKAARDSGDRRFDEFLDAHAAVEKAVWTAGERAARERRQAAIKKLIETI
jgi:hypothetical protein